jgi:hypothetical protein
MQSTAAQRLRWFHAAGPAGALWGCHVLSSTLQYKIRVQLHFNCDSAAGRIAGMSIDQVYTSYISGM